MITSKKIYNDFYEKNIIINSIDKRTDFNELPYDQEGKESVEISDEIPSRTCSQCMQGFFPLRYIKD
jgi:hypothetical protein